MLLELQFWVACIPPDIEIAILFFDLPTLKASIELGLF